MKGLQQTNTKKFHFQEDLILAGNGSTATVQQDDDFDILDFDHSPVLGIDQNLLATS